MAIQKPGVAPQPPQALIPHLVVRGGVKAIEFYRKAFGAEELDRNVMPDGKLLHAELRILGSTLMLADEFEGMSKTRSPQTLGGTACFINLSVDDCDAAFQRAVTAGATVVMPPADMFWGDRYGQVQDPFGHLWSFNQIKEWISPEESQARMMKAMPPG